MKGPDIQGKHCGIYIIKNKINGLVYIGQSINIKKRIREHCSNYLNPTALIDSAIKNNLQNFSWDILEECPKEDLNYLEKYYIYYYNSMNFGYNRTFGGEQPTNFLCGEAHPRTTRTNEEVLNIRKYYSSHSIQDTYNKYKKENESFSSFKGVLHNSYKNLPIYKKTIHKWIYPIDWEGEEIENISINNLGLTDSDIMNIRRQSVFISPLTLFEKKDYPNLTLRQLQGIINGSIYHYLPYYNRKNKKWIYPKNWEGKVEEENNLDKEELKKFFLIRTERGSLYGEQILLSRYLYSKGKSSKEIYEKLKGKNFPLKLASLESLNLNRTYLNFPTWKKGSQEWNFPENYTKNQKDFFLSDIIPYLEEKAKEMNF